MIETRMNEELKRNMRARIDKCRRLAELINDPRTKEALLAMAEEGEADLAKLEADEASALKAGIQNPQAPEA